MSDDEEFTEFDLLSDEIDQLREDLHNGFATTMQLLDEISCQLDQNGYQLPTGHPNTDKDTDAVGPS